ncbi:unnamed protein product [Acanthoscelides obtectus]|uniref:Uncharacterized protein n=1 Tax=Acanthoscelides obtectus TaxID=200917 RepID=A0A9P0PZN0_ACAOB|nr:unnamed protein product [Acanthoscelides obtectus]CAK1644531.1 hypothetical protein AOBTE_LOCUS13861 [Acanthoscelides obtectus]
MKNQRLISKTLIVMMYQQYGVFFPKKIVHQGVWVTSSRIRHLKASGGQPATSEIHSEAGPELRTPPVHVFQVGFGVDATRSVLVSARNGNNGRMIFFKYCLQKLLISPPCLCGR